MEIIASLNLPMQIFLLTISALLLGSFISLLSYRLATKEPIVFARSKCVNCGVALKIKNLIPLFSWIFQLGKCGNCKGKISWRYPLIELGCVAAFLVVYFALGSHLDLKTILYCLIAATMILMVATDIEHYFIPDISQIFLALLVAVAVIAGGGTNAAIVNVKAAFIYLLFSLALYGFFYFVAKIEAIGVDDMKFFFIAGLMLGMNGFLPFMLLSGVFGILFGVCWHKIKKEEIFPFAPALCMSMFVCMLFSKKIDPIDLVGSLLFL